MMESDLELEEARRELETLKEGYKDIKTDEELGTYRKKVRVAWNRLWKIDEDFRNIILEKAKSMGPMVGDIGKRIKTRRGEILREAGLARDKTMKRNVITPPPSMTGAPDNLYNKKRRLICPICMDIDRGNVINDVHMCIGCMHELVPIGDISKYNRKYRRAWKKLRKKTKKHRRR